MKRALIIFVKAPITGKVKTRLQPCIASEKVVEIYKSFVTEILTKCSGIKRVNKFLGCTPTKDDDFLKAMKKTYRMKMFLQRGASLSERIFNAFQDHFKKGYTEVVLIGSDSPTIPLDYIKTAFFKLKRTDFIIGPCFDQGLYLIGAQKKKANDIFRNLRLDTGEDVNTILRLVNTMNIKFSMLPFWYDVDTIDDLRFLETHRQYLNKNKR
jgi:rSAM/selenodomain-associated transferase 1